MRCSRAKAAAAFASSMPSGGPAVICMQLVERAGSIIEAAEQQRIASAVGSAAPGAARHDPGADDGGRECQVELARHVGAGGDAGDRGLAVRRRPGPGVARSRRRCAAKEQHGCGHEQRGRKVDMTCPQRSYADEASRMTAKPLCRFSHPPAIVVDQQQVPQHPLLHLALPVHHGAAAAARQRNAAADRAAEATARTSASAQRPGTFRGPLRWSM